MIALYEHIQQRACYMTRRERAAVRAELAKAVADQADLDRAFDRAFEAPLRGQELSYVQSPQCATAWQAAGGGSRLCRPAATVGLKRQKPGFRPISRRNRLSVDDLAGAAEAGAARRARRHYAPSREKT
jgi:hypothetical protein